MVAEIESPPDKAKPKQGHRFQPGQSGNPQGCKTGSRHKSTLLLEKMMADDGQDVVRSVISAAKGGDMVAARLVLDRICPPRKGRAIQIDLPTISRAEDVLQALAAVVAAVADGEVTPEEGQIVSGMLEVQRRTIETVDLEQRLAALEHDRG